MALTPHREQHRRTHQASCAGYVYPEANITADIANLCSAMPDMIGCTLADSCKVRVQGCQNKLPCTKLLQARDDTTGYCNKLSLLGNICVDMPGMGGCRRYNALCKNTTKVEQCSKV